MGLLDWFRRDTVPASEPDTVAYYDAETQQLVRIPRSELRPGAVQVQIEGIDYDGPVWVLPDQLEAGPIQHERFDEDVRDYIRRIQDVFAEHRSLSFEEWEDGFRRDRDPVREIALWSHAADVYAQCAEHEHDAERRRDIFLCIVTCMNTGPETVWDVLRPAVLDQADADRVITMFYGTDADHHNQNQS